jgi:FKBP-type peptidyl-prolyl cis-trans isomerase SlyD
MSDQRIVANKAVHFTYHIIDEHGTQLEHSDIPIGYVHGANSAILPKIGESLGGHKVGDVIDITVSPEEGFGPYLKELTFTDDVDNVPPEFRQIGADVEMRNEQGEVRQFHVAKIENGKLTVDGNHPLAGKTLRFTVTITEIRDASNEEIANGQLVDGPHGQLQ